MTSSPFRNIAVRTSTPTIAFISGLAFVAGVIAVPASAFATVTPTVTSIFPSHITATDATLKGKNGAVDAVGHSFWVSRRLIKTTSANIPAGVYSTPDMGAISSSTPFTVALSSLTTDAVTTGGATGVNLPAITPNTTYFYVAWVKVGDTWYHGDNKSFTTASSPDNGGGTVTPPTPSAVTN